VNERERATGRAAGPRADVSDRPAIRILSRYDGCTNARAGIPDGRQGFGSKRMELSDLTAEGVESAMAEETSTAAAWRSRPLRSSGSVNAQFREEQPSRLHRLAQHTCGYFLAQPGVT